MTSRTKLASAFLRTHLLHRWLNSRDRVARWQNWNLERLRRHAVAHAAFYRELGNLPFRDFPIVGKREVMNRFEAFNQLGLSAAEGWAWFGVSARSVTVVPLDKSRPSCT